MHALPRKNESMNSHRPETSVIIPVYNRADYIAETIESVLSQTYKDYEVIVVNDGSTNAAVKEVLKPYMAVINYFYKENGGIASARNFGIQRSRGDYIAFLDSDDVWQTDKLYQQVNFLKNNPEMYMCYTELELIDEHGNTIGYSDRRRKIPLDGMVIKYVFEHHGIMPSSIMVKREIFNSIGLFDESFRDGGEDTDFLFRAAAAFPIGLIDKPLTKYRQYDMNTSKHAHIHARQLQAIRNFLDGKLKFAEANRPLVRKVLAEVHKDYAEDLLVNNDFRGALKQISKHLYYAGLNNAKFSALFKITLANVLGVKFSEYLRNIKKKLKSGASQNTYETD